VEWVETTAKTVEEAKDLALDKLGVDEADAEFEVLEEPRQGLFGRTRGEARVRARVEPKAPRAKEERPRKRRKPKGDNNRSNKPAGQRAASASDGTGRAEAADAEPTESSSSDASERPAAKGRRSPSGGRNKRSEKPQRSEQPERKESSMEEVRTCVDEFLTGLVAAFDIDTPVTIDDSDEQIVATIEGKHGLLLGPKARTLDAIQELTRVTAQRTAPSSIRIKVDVGGYREARRTALAGFAQQAAEKARAEGIDVVLESMSAADRKVVHDTLNDEPGVSTRSAGTDPRRYVIVVPDQAEAVDAADDGEEEADTDD
jgi:spoIIIJ-associated protein